MLGGADIHCTNLNVIFRTKVQKINMAAIPRVEFWPHMYYWIWTGGFHIILNIEHLKICTVLVLAYCRYIKLQLSAMVGTWHVFSNIILKYLHISSHRSFSRLPVYLCVSKYHPNIWIGTSVFHGRNHSMVGLNISRELWNRQRSRISPFSITIETKYAEWSTSLALVS